MSNPLSEIQAQLKVPKSQFNSFGKYAYRSAEDILEAAKPILSKHGFFVTLSDEIVLVGDRYYVKATATLSNGQITYTSTAFAREDETKKGMDGAQCTGSTSSYARKYALNGLLATDDTRDSDATNTHGADVVTTKKTEFRKLCEKYSQSKLVKVKPLNAVVFDCLKKHNLPDLAALKECSSTAVFDDLIEVMSATLAS